METQNPFKQLEPDATCPEHLKTELISEIDIIRNLGTILEIYVGDLLGVASVLANPSPRNT